MEGDRVATRARVIGRVQGVSYRAWAQSEAERRGLTGWVGNERDGSVAALLVGPEAVVREMIAALWVGPPAAAVVNVTSEPAEPGDAPSRFTIAY